MSAYIALIHKEDGSDYGVSFPDFPGCVTAGGTLDEARANAAEALAVHVEGMIEDGEALPEPSGLATVMRERENRDAVAFLVEAPAPFSKTVRVNITLPEDELGDIDALAERGGYSRSGVIKATLSAASFSVNPWERTIQHLPTNAMWRYDDDDNLTLLSLGRLDEARRDKITNGARKALHDERRRTIKGSFVPAR